jgi:aminopeptidase N
VKSRLAWISTLALLGGVAACSDDAGVFAKNSVSVETTTGVPTAASPTTVVEVPAAPASTTAELPTTVPGDVTPSTDVEAPAADAGTAGAPGFGDEYFPTYGNGGYDVASYDIDLTWDPTSGQIEATTAITATATQDLSSFNLELSGLTATSIEINGEPATFSAKGLELTVTPAERLADGDEFTTVIAYGGEPKPQPGKAGIPGGWFRDPKRGVMVFGEPEGAASWYPVNDHPMDKALYTIRVTAPSDLTVAANGVEKGRTVAGANTVWEFAPEFPQSSYLTTIVIGEYTIVDGGASTNGTPIRNVFPNDRVTELTEVFAMQPKMIDVLESWFGPYPFEVYGSAVADDIQIGGALEVQTLSLYDSFATDELIIVHELAHQWYGDSVGLEKWQDIWLNEGFASYSEQLWQESLDPTYDITADYELTATQISDLLAVPAGDPGPDELFGATVYIRGGMTLHALRLEIGDDNFRTLLKAWSSTYQYESATTNDFIAMAEEISGEQLDTLFDEWLFTEGLPEKLGDVPLPD